MSESNTLNKIKIIIPFYNPGTFLDSCILSVLTQNYDNYEILFIDDASTDGSYERIPACTFKSDETGKPIVDEDGKLIILDQHPLLKKTKCLNVVAWRASSRATALPNIHNAIINFCTDPDDIVVIVDGDDHLSGKWVLSYINDMYVANKDKWFIYGSSLWTDGRKCCSSAYTREEFKDIRKAPFRISHLRTFRAGLYHKIAEQDTNFSCMMDKNSNWYTSSYDTVMCYPMLELAGYDHVMHNSKPIYIYNRHNPLSDDKVDQFLQWDVHKEITLKKPFNIINNYK